jgi:serine/threonine protein kinase
MTASESMSPPLIRVLQQFTLSSKDGGWIVERLDEGGHGHVFAIRSHDGQPVWRNHRSLVIKLYKPAATPSVELARAQFEALSWVYTALNGRDINGWKISTPLPLYVCKSPDALVMTPVPGVKLTSLLELDNKLSAEVLKSISRAVVAAMHTCWATGKLHGDLHPDNILSDVAARNLSFVDLGMPASFSVRDHATERWYPASNDLAYLLYATEVRFKRDIGHPSARARKQAFAENVLRAFVETIGPAEEKQLALDEIQAFTRLHLKGLDASLSPRGLWKALVRRVASRRIDAMLGTLKAALGHLDMAA